MRYEIRKCQIYYENGVILYCLIGFANLVELTFALLVLIDLLALLVLMIVFIAFVSLSKRAFRRKRNFSNRAKKSADICKNAFLPEKK